MKGTNRYHNGHSPSNGPSGNGEFTSLNQNTNAGKGDEDEIDLRELFFMLWAKKWLISGTVIACGLAAYIIAASMTPIYKSRGTLLFSSSQNTIISSMGGLGSLMSNFGIGGGSSITNEILLLKSRSFSRAVADSLLEQQYMKNGKQFPILYEGYPDSSQLALKDTVAARLREDMVIKKVKQDAGFLAITYESPSAVGAAQVINVTLDVYSDFKARRKQMAAGTAVQFLKEERSRLKDSLRQAEERLRTFMNRTGLVQVDTQTQELIRQLTELEAKLYEARAKLKATNAAITKYEEQLNNIKPNLAEQLSDVTSSNMKRLQIQLAELRFKKTRLIARNPGIKKKVPVPDNLTRLNRKIEKYKQRIKTSVQELIKKGDQYLSFLISDMVPKNIATINKKLIKLRVQKQQYGAQVNILSEQIARLEQFFHNLPDNMIKLARLKRQVMLYEKLYAMVSKKYYGMSLRAEKQFGLAQPVDHGYIPDKPVKPQTLLFILVGFILGGIGSVGYVLTKEAFNGTINKVKTLEERPVPLLGVIPKIRDHIKERYAGREKITVRGRKVSSRLVTVSDPNTSMADSFRSIKNNILFANPDRNLKSITFTGTGKEAESITVASNVGTVLAEAGYKTVIVDGDFRRANLHNMFGISRTPGIKEVLYDDLSLQKALKETVVPGLEVLTAGRQISNPSAVIQSSAFLQTIEGLRNTFDFVLVNTPPFGISTDASALIKQTDGTAVTVKFNQTTESQIDYTLESLNHINASVLGTVLTAFDSKKSLDAYYSSQFSKEAYQEYAVNEGQEA